MTSGVDPRDPVTDGLPMPQRLLAVVAISLGTMLAVIDGHIVTVAIPTLAHDLRVSGSQAVLVVTVYQLTLVMTMLPFSALGDRVGLKRMYQYGQLLFTIATALCFFADSLPFLLLIRVLQAVGAAGSLSVMVALIRHTYPARRIGQGMGINALIVSITAAAAPTAGGMILAFAPWPWLFVGALPFAILSLWLGRQALPEIQPSAEPYNWTGALLNVASFGLIFGGVESAVDGNSWLLSAAIVALGILVAIWFIRHERPRAKPILPIDLLVNPLLRLSVVGGFLSAFGDMVLVLSLPFRLEQMYGFSPGEVGAIITPYPAATMVVAPLAGILSDRIHPGILGGVGMAISTTAIVLIAFPPHDPTYLDFAWRMALWGSGAALYYAPNARLIVGATPHHRTSAAGGLIQVTRLTAMTAGATSFAVILSLGLGNTIAPAVVAASFAAIAGFCSVARLTNTAKAT